MALQPLVAARRIAAKEVECARRPRRRSACPARWWLANSIGGRSVHLSLMRTNPGTRPELPPIPHPPYLIMFCRGMVVEGMSPSFPALRLW